MFIPFSTFESGHSFSISWKVRPSHPAFVANGFIIFPVKSYFVKKVLITGAIVYHQTGLPTIISSYLLKSLSIDCISGFFLELSLFCSSSTTVW